MLRANEIKQRMSHILQTIDQAEQACKTGETPAELKACLHKMASEAKKADDVIATKDDARIIECVDSLEDMGDDAKRLSRSDAHISPQVESAVTKVHAELSDLKHKLH